MPGCWAASAANASADRADAATLTPDFAKCKATARPIPELAPVIHTTRQEHGGAKRSKSRQGLDQASDPTLETRRPFTCDDTNTTEFLICNRAMFKIAIEIGHVTGFVSAEFVSVAPA